jgi:phosphatidylserine/phosphatidylglycerophosphate/cardiolipin synthase-like enzyme
VDGPRDDADDAATALIASGSANWNAGGASFDENTLFLTGNSELALRMQREFNLMWHNSRALDVFPGVQASDSSLEITDSMIASVDDPNADVWMTSDNYSVSNETFKTDERDSVSSKMVEAIENADQSILVASGHLRSRPIAEALIARAEADPSLDIRVYLDGQEYISPFTHDIQVQKVEDCLASASTEIQERNCLAKGFLFGFQVGETDGIDVRYKYYAYRWNHSYADQMHHKYIIIDGEELYTGSYNFSDNAEHSSFENVFVFKGAAYQPLIDAYVSNFESIWRTNDSGALEALLAEVRSGDTFPIVFEAMALTHSEVRNLKSEIIDNCSAVNSSEYRSNPTAHRFCDPND